ncbi:hypothetical protein [Parabacteroides sp.]
MNVKEFFNSFGFYERIESTTFEVINRSKIDDTKNLASLYLREKRRKRLINEYFAEHLLKKVYDVIELLDNVSEFSLDQLDYDPYVDDSIVIYFKNRSIRLNLYVNRDVDSDSEDFEEAYLDFIRNNESHLVNDTVPNIVKLLNKLLR